MFHLSAVRRIHLLYMISRKTSTDSFCRLHKKAALKAKALSKPFFYTVSQYEIILHFVFPRF